ncbi:MAG: bifunctional phosphopantothenoylcysteine decarboxylase/phosphopantothenate--cysteine ligase CoaBC [Eubacteriales bacterium]|nr:bifunctional phosphopantothenoylcysteine decarboxylase/phosphopantothenate--cysteine ligase CoaBC [Eubacteriales bacterium]
MSKSVIVGVSGGIAAYKAAYLVSAFKKKGYDVHVIMTKNALEFISALTFETLSGNAVITDMFERKEPYDVKHVTLAKKADMFIIAPATANVIAKIASGIADDMLTTTLLAAKCPVVIAPAMNTAMYDDAATQKNLGVLKQLGCHVMDTGEGVLACGDTGQGRMREPQEIIDYAEDVFRSLYDMHGICVLVSAGPTRERIDPVRYLSNHSSGKMGYAIAEAAINRGADVTLVSGPVALEKPQKAKTVDVISAAEMTDMMLALSNEADIIIMAAAVADYKPKESAEHKIKKGVDLNLALVRTTDILAEIGAHRREGQLIMGFAAETQDFEKNALAKLTSKNLDIIALNDVSKAGEGFGADRNNIKLFYNNGKTADLGSGSKQYLGKCIVEKVREHYLKINDAR